MCSTLLVFIRKDDKFYEQKDVIVINEEIGMSYIKLFNKIIPFEESGKDENTMGLRLLMLMFDSK